MQSPFNYIDIMDTQVIHYGVTIAGYLAGGAGVTYGWYIESSCECGYVDTSGMNRKQSRDAGKGQRNREGGFKTYRSGVGGSLVPPGAHGEAGIVIGLIPFGCIEDFEGLSRSVDANTPFGVGGAYGRSESGVGFGKVTIGFSTPGGSYGGNKTILFD